MFLFRISSENTASSTDIESFLELGKDFRIGLEVLNLKLVISI